MERFSRIFVAGSQELIGRAIVAALRQQEYVNVVGVGADEPDLSDAVAVDAFFREARPEYVFHAGGPTAGIAGNQRRGGELLRENLLAGVHVIECARKHGSKKLLYLASSCSYPRQCSQPMKEESILSGPLEPTNEPYAVAKIAGMKLCQAYRKQYGCDFIVGIPANAFGPGDDFDPEDSHVIAALLRRFHVAKCENAESVTIWGTGQARREFLFAPDLADACLHVMQTYRGAEPINLGGGSSLTIGELATMIGTTVGFSGRLVFDTTRPDGMPVKELDSSTVLSSGWRPKTEFAQALRETYHDFLTHGEKV